MNDVERALDVFAKVITKGAIITNAEIVSVDETAYTCVVKTTNATYYSVPLKVLISSKASFIEIPKVGSQVLICCRERNTALPQLLMCHEIDKLLLTVGASTLEVTDGLFKFNGGTKGMVKIDSLITKLNNLENTLNTFMNTTFNTHTHICAVPASPSATPLPINTATLTPTVQTDIENTKIKQ